MLSVVRRVCPERKKWRDTAVKVVLKPSCPSDFWKRVLEVHAAKVFLNYFVLTCGAFRSSGHFQLEQKGKIYRDNQFFPADFPINPYIDEFWVNITIPSAIKSRILPATRPPCVVDFHGFSYYSSIFSYDLPIKTFIFPSFFHGTFGISQLFGSVETLPRPRCESHGRCGARLRFERLGGLRVQRLEHDLPDASLGWWMMGDPMGDGGIKKSLDGLYIYVHLWKLLSKMRSILKILRMLFFDESSLEWLLWWWWYMKIKMKMMMMMLHPLTCSGDVSPIQARNASKKWGNSDSADFCWIVGWYPLELLTISDMDEHGRFISMIGQLNNVKLLNMLVFHSNLSNDQRVFLGNWYVLRLEGISHG